MSSWFVELIYIFREEKFFCWGNELSGVFWSDVLCVSFQSILCEFDCVSDQALCLVG